MQMFGGLIAILVGIVCFGLATWHERTWRQRFQNCKRVVGYIVSEIKHPGEIDTSWRIEYELDGETMQFTSLYGGSKFGEVGDAVTVIHDLNTNTGEHLTWSNRWGFTLFPMLFGIVFVVAGITAYYAN